MSIRRSFNIKYDIGNSDILDGYYATGSHSNVIRSVLDGVIDGSQCAHIAYGPYGSGKSYISTILINILSKNFGEEELNHLSRKFSEVDTEVSKRFIDSANSRIKFIPVLLNGYEGGFQSAVLKALQKSLRNNNIDIFTSRMVAGISDIIRNWESNFSETYLKFDDFVRTRKISTSDFLDKISDDIELAKDFSNFYKEVSSGASISSDDDSSLIDTLEDTLARLSKMGLGIFIVYDEFGRMLQNVKPNEVNSFMELLQSLAELANTGSKNLSILFVAHKPIGHYFTYLNRDIRSEFSKIEKRFSISEIKSDNNTFVTITQEVIKSKRSVFIENDQIQEHSRQLSKFRLFSSSMNDTEIENKIIRDCYPLHPVTLFSLPRISNIFGQNERTLFTFLHDESSFGLTGFLYRKGGYFYPDQLVDYFFSTMDNTELENLKEVSMYRKALSQTKGYFDSNSIESANRILKFCFLWTITSSSSYVNLTQNFISYAIGIDGTSVERILSTFFEKKIMRVNAIKKSLEIIEASAVNLELEINKKMNIQETNKKLINDTLNRLNPYKYIYPNKYNNTNDITRFAEVEINIDGFEPVDFSSKAHDLLVKIAIHNKEDFKVSVEELTEISCNIRLDTVRIVAFLRRVAALMSLAEDRHFLAEYRNVDLEISHEILLIQRKLDEFYIKLLSKDLILVSHLGEFRIKNFSNLETVINNQISNVYNKSLIIHNDQINMYLISNIQEKSIIKVIDFILRTGTLDIGKLFDGNKPEYLVYYSMISSNYTEIRNEIREFIRNHENGSLDMIFDIMRKPPYGIRPTLLSLVLIVSTYDMWKNIMFFNKESFIAELPAQNLYLAGKGVYDYQYSYSNFDFENRALLEKIVSDFGMLSEGVLNKSLTIRACSSLYNWYLALPVIIQLGNNIGIQERYFTRAIEKAKTNPRESIETIVELIGDDWSVLDEIKKNIEEAFDLYLEIFDSKVRKSLKVDSWKTWAANLNDAIARSNEFVRICLEVECVVRRYAKTIDSLEIERWPISMFDVLRSNIENLYASLSDEINTIEIQINGVIRHVHDVNLSQKAMLLKTNLTNLIEANRRYITKAEVEKVIIEIVEKNLK